MEDKYKLLVPVEYTEAELEAMWKRAVKYGRFRRADKAAKWTLAEKRECIRHYLAQLAARELGRCNVPVM